MSKQGPVARVFLAFLVVGVAGEAAGAESTPDVQAQLANRFRPYIKSTLDSGHDDPFRPCGWEWFIGHSNLFRRTDTPIDSTSVFNVDLSYPNYGYWVTLIRDSASMSNDPRQLISPEDADIRDANVQSAQYYYYLQMLDGVTDFDQYRHGEPWGDVIHHGDGIYAHLEEIDGRLINIEYTLLFARNVADLNQHDGDIATIEVVYDRVSDLITRVTYGIHGCVIEEFRTANPYYINLASLAGLDENMQVVMVHAARLTVRAHIDEYQEEDGCPCPVGSCHSPSDVYVYLVQDPDTQRYEHPAIYLEQGAHEPWPNNTGSVPLMPAHDGDGVSFLPDRNTVGVLGSLGPKTGKASIEAAEEPFVFYNGKVGTDPETVMRHRSWYWPEGRESNRYNIPSDLFVDKPDPYVTHNNLPWPPLPESGSATVYVDAHAGPLFDGSLAAPYPDAVTANSFVALGGVISVAAGSYPGEAKFSRKCTIIARDGIVTLGGH